jgi:predicted ATPase/DNA-binding winged helix-turn-helix (wHTH) protein
MDPPSEAPEFVVFGRFRLFPRRRELLADGAPVKLGGRAFDILMALIEARGTVVSKDQLMATVWPDRVVEENNLQWQISSLRAALGPDRHLIRTIPGRGYQFVGELRLAPRSTEDRHEPNLPPPAAAAAPPGTNLPISVSELIGRDVELEEILSLLAGHRLVTLTGPGGIGKTQLALAAARRLLPQFPDGVWLAELAALTDSALVPITVARATGLEIGAGPAFAERVAAALTMKSLLLVLDNCEHVIDAAATLAEALLHADSRVRILATSREPLNTEGEQVYPVPPLAVPAEGTEDLDTVLNSGAVHLFLERARAAEPRLAIDRSAALTVAAICRRLDGIPLAIELAAARIGALGIEQIAARLDSGFDLLTVGRRTALPRHQTLRATFDWSYGLLSEFERVILRRLSIFNGTFSLEAAEAIVASPELAAPAVIDGLFSLVAKSLVTREGDGAVSQYRLLETTRDYACGKLDEAGERQHLARRHAAYYHDFFERAAAEWGIRSAPEWVSRYQPEIGNLRAALDWAFAPLGDLPTGIGLAAVSAPLWLSMSLIGEWHVWTEKAIHSLDEAGLRGTRQEMMLQAALGISLQLARNRTSEARAALMRALELAEHLGDTDYQLRIVHTFWIYHMRVGEVRSSLALADRATAIVASLPDLAASATAQWMLGISLHFAGEHGAARCRLERLLHQNTFLCSRSYYIGRAGFDLCVAARYVLARVLWVQGYPDQAIQTVRESIAEARCLGSPATLCGALALGGCTLAIQCGDFDDASQLATELVAHAQQHALADWVAYGEALQEILSSRTAAPHPGADRFRLALRRWRAAQWHIGLPINDFIGIAANSGSADELLAILDEELERSERNQELWALPETLRVKGELLLLRAEPDPGLAGEYFLRSLDRARAQGALSWELRTSISLARLGRRRGRSADALALLEQVYSRFTEGFETADLKSAKTLLDTLRQI